MQATGGSFETSMATGFILPEHQQSLRDALQSAELYQLCTILIGFEDHVRNCRDHAAEPGSGPGAVIIPRSILWP